MAHGALYKTSIGEDGRLELRATGLPAGRVVQVLVIDTGEQITEPKVGLVEWLKNLPPRRTEAEWEQFDKDFQAERDSWDK